MNDCATCMYFGKCMCDPTFCHSWRPKESQSERCN